MHSKSTPARVPRGWLKSSLILGAVAWLMGAGLTLLIFITQDHLRRIHQDFDISAPGVTVLALHPGLPFLLLFLLVVGTLVLLLFGAAAFYRGPRLQDNLTWTLSFVLIAEVLAGFAYAFAGYVLPTWKLTFQLN